MSITVLLSYEHPTEKDTILRYFSESSSKEDFLEYIKNNNFVRVNSNTKEPFYISLDECIAISFGEAFIKNPEDKIFQLYPKKNDSPFRYVSSAPSFEEFCRRLQTDKFIETMGPSSVYYPTKNFRSFSIGENPIN